MIRLITMLMLAAIPAAVIAGEGYRGHQFPGGVAEGDGYRGHKSPGGVAPGAGYRGHDELIASDLRSSNGRSAATTQSSDRGQQSESTRGNQTQGRK